MEGLVIWWSGQSLGGGVGDLVEWSVAWWRGW